MKLYWQKGSNVICLGHIFKDGVGAIVMIGKMKKPWVWKAKV